MEKGSICLVVAVAMLCSLQLCAAAQFTVGGSKGWTFQVDYTAWAAQNTYKVGDTLLFMYTKGAHNVLQVSKADYDSCTSGNAIATFTESNAVVSLKAEGMQWYICGIPGHCSGGMKLAVNVLASSSNTAPAAAPKAPERKLTPSAAPAAAPIAPGRKLTPSAAPAAAPKSPGRILTPSAAPTVRNQPFAESPKSPTLSPIAPSPTSGSISPSQSPIAPSPTSESISPPQSGPAMSNGPSSDVSPPTESSPIAPTTKTAQPPTDSSASSLFSSPITFAAISLLVILTV